MNVLARKVANNLIRSTRSALPFSTSNTNSLFHHNNINQITGNNVNILTRQRRKRTTTIIGTSINNNYSRHSVTKNYLNNSFLSIRERVVSVLSLFERVKLLF